MFEVFLGVSVSVVGFFISDVIWCKFFCPKRDSCCHSQFKFKNKDGGNKNVQN